MENIHFLHVLEKHIKLMSLLLSTEALLVSGNGANVGYIHYFKASLMPIKELMF